MDGAERADCEADDVPAVLAEAACRLSGRTVEATRGDCASDAARLVGDAAKVLPACRLPAGVVLEARTRDVVGRRRDEVSATVLPALP